MRMHKFYVGIYNKTLIKLNSKNFFSLWETTLKLVFIDWHVSLWVPLLIHCLVPNLYKFNLIKGIAWQKLFRYFGKWSMVLYTHRKEKLLSILFLCSSLFILKFLTAILSWFLIFLQWNIITSDAKAIFLLNITAMPLCSPPGQNHKCTIRFKDNQHFRARSSEAIICSSKYEF